MKWVRISDCFMNGMEVEAKEIQPETLVRFIEEADDLNHEVRTSDGVTVISAEEWYDVFVPSFL